MANDLMQLTTRQEQLSDLADKIRNNGSNEPVVILTLASILAKLAQIEVALTGKIETHCCSEQDDDDLPF